MPADSVEALGFGNGGDGVNNYVSNECITAAVKIWNRGIRYRILDLTNEAGKFERTKTRKGESSEE